MTDEQMKAFRDFGIAAAKAWDTVTGNDAIWQMRIDGPVYRQTFLLGHFRAYRRLRVWLLRRQLQA